MLEGGCLKLFWLASAVSSRFRDCITFVNSRDEEFWVMNLCKPFFLVLCEKSVIFRCLSFTCIRILSFTGIHLENWCVYIPFASSKTAAKDLHILKA
ncbi:hypothetical protein CEXT_311691 [Caerostris extrusa]|uniref:Secreted protein n=1 Tax=Caerostris extrusa TaxID=172846 RepID=A0AAV4XN25_CAEEX|nr:hypothetical protein CEXT_311691 [Caerostris extrusa]